MDIFIEWNEQLCQSRSKYDSLLFFPNVNVSCNWIFHKIENRDKMEKRLARNYVKGVYG